MLNLKDLHYLVVLSQTRHFGKAADACFVSQPTLSGQLKKLENQLGAKLIEQSKPKVLFTPLGKQIIIKAQQMLTQGLEIEALSKSATDPYQSTIKLALIPSLAAYIMPLVTEQIRYHLPNTNIILTELQTHQLIEQLQQGDIDAGLLALPKPILGLDDLHLWIEPFYLAVPSSHKWASRKIINSEELSSQTMLILEDGHCLAEQTRRLCSEANSINQYKGTSLETLRHMVSIGYGVTLVPKLAKDLWLRQGEQGIAFVGINNPKPGRQLGFLTRTGSAVQPVVQRCHDLFEAVLPKDSASKVIGFNV